MFVILLTNSLSSLISEKRIEKVQVFRSQRSEQQSGLNRTVDVNRWYFVGKRDISSSGDRKDKFIDNESVDANRAHTLQ